MIGGSKGAEEYSFSIPNSAQQGNISSREAEPNRKGNVRRTVKELLAQQESRRYIEAVLTEEDRKHSTPKQERRKKWLESEELRKECKGIVNMYSHIADRLNDQNPKSTETLLAKMQKELGMSDEEFIAHVDYARQKVLSIPQDKIRKRGADGQPNRTPLFIQILKDALKRGIDTCQEDDQRADEIRNMVKVMNQQPAPVVEIEQEVFDEVVDTFLRPALEASRQTREEILAEILPSGSSHELQVGQPQEPTEQNQAQTFELPTDKWTSAKYRILEVIPSRIIVIVSRMQTCSCGCKIIARKGSLAGCVVCKPPVDWSSKVRTEIAGIVAQARLEEAV